MKILLVILFTVVFKLSFSQDNYFKPKYLASLDTSWGKLLLQQCSRSTPDSISRIFKVACNDLDVLLENFKKIVKEEKLLKRIKDLGLYGYQLIGVIINNKKFIYINAWLVNEEHLKTINREWRQFPVIGCGGGERYWGAVFDVSEKAFFNYEINVEM